MSFPAQQENVKVSLGKSLREQFIRNYKLLAALRIAAANPAAVDGDSFEGLDEEVSSFIRDSGRDELRRWVEAFRSTFVELDRSYELYDASKIDVMPSPNEWSAGIEAEQIALKALSDRIRELKHAS